MFFQPTRESPTPDKPRRRVPGGGRAWGRAWGRAGRPLFSSKKRRVPSSLRKKHYLCTRICACGEIGRRARLRIWWFRPCRFESYQAHISPLSPQTTICAKHTKRATPCTIAPFRAVQGVALYFCAPPSVGGGYISRCRFWNAGATDTLYSPPEPINSILLLSAKL